MLSGKVRVLNFDDSLVRQKELLRKYSPQVTDLTDIAPSCRLWSSRKYADMIRGRLTPEERGAITFLGSGDFHHISSLLIEQFSGPLGIVIFDFHPDWDILPPRLGCGSWVSNVLRMKNVEKVVIIAASSSDLSSIWIQTGNLNSLKDDRVEIFPYAHKSTLALFKRVPENISIRVERGIFSSRIYWQELKDLGLEEFFRGVAERMGKRKVYLSLDKDCMDSRGALTNWEEGLLSLDELLLALSSIKESCDIVGADITGEYSPPASKGRLKTFFSRLDHPKEFTAKAKPQALIDAVNEKTNLRILEALAG